jgi:hypothetical protein
MAAAAKHGDLEAHCCDHSMYSEAESSCAMSQMGESVRYQEHVSQYTLERTRDLLTQIKDSILFYAVATVILLPFTLIANNLSVAWLPLMPVSYAQPLIARTGCQIGLNTWYIVFTSLIAIKLLIEASRYFVV